MLSRAKRRYHRWRRGTNTATDTRFQIKKITDWQTTHSLTQLHIQNLFFLIQCFHAVQLLFQSITNTQYTLILNLSVATLSTLTKFNMLYETQLVFHFPAYCNHNQKQILRNHYKNEDTLQRRTYRRQQTALWCLDYLGSEWGLTCADQLQ